jgi:hypothetical protein
VSGIYHVGDEMPVTRDFVRIGRVPYWGDTLRMRQELVRDLEYPTFREGLSTLV